MHCLYPAMSRFLLCVEDVFSLSLSPFFFLQRCVPVGDRLAQPYVWDSCWPDTSTRPCFFRCFHWGWLFLVQRRARMCEFPCWILSMKILRPRRWSSLLWAKSPQQDPG